MKRIIFLSILIVTSLACSTAQKIVATATPVTPTLTPTRTETPSPTETPTLTPTPEFSCPNAPESQVKIGDIARVTEGDTPVRLRRDPVVINENILTVLVEGKEMEIIDGPECAPIPDSQASYVFWKVLIADNPINSNVGWVAEGTMENYYIEPISTP